MNGKMFAGKDFLKMDPPPNYKPGIGRGALGFTSRGNLGSTAIHGNLPVQRRPDDDDDMALKIYQNVDKRKKRTLTEEEFEDAEQDKPEISVKDWLEMPEATDLTWRTKRLRQERNANRRTYDIPDTIISEKLSSVGPDFAQMVKVDPQNPVGWIGYAKSLYEAKNFKKTRKVLEKAVQQCHKTPEVWITAIDLRPSLEEQRVIAARAVEALPQSTEIWQKAIDIEPTESNKLKVVHKALETNPTTAKFWLEAIKYEQSQDLKLALIKHAAEFCPKDESVWLQYHDLDNSLTTLDMGISQLPDSVLLSSRRAFYYETAGDLDSLSKVIAASPPSEQWPSILNANPDFSATAKLLVERFELRPESLEAIPAKEFAYRLWGSREPELYLEWAAVGCNPSEPLELAVTAMNEPRTWEAYIEHNDSLEILKRAYEAFPDHFRSRYVARAPSMEIEPTSAADYLDQIERLGDNEKALELCRQGRNKFPDCGRLYWLEYHIEPNENLLTTGLQQDPGCVPLWLELINRTESAARKRSVIARAMAANPRNEQLWLEKLALDKTKDLVASAVQECPSSGPIWYEYLQLLDGFKRKAKFAEALEKTQQHGDVLFSLGLYYHNRQNPAAETVMHKASKTSAKAKQWLEEH